MPDGQGLVHPPGEKAGGRVAYNGGAAGERGGGIRLRPVPDAPVGVLRRHAVDQVEGPVPHGQLQMVGQAGEEPEHLPPLPGGADVEQAAVGAVSAVLPPEGPAAVDVVGPQGVQAHLLMVAQQHMDVVRGHDLQEQVHTAGAAVDDVPDDVQRILAGELDFFQHGVKAVLLAVEVGHAVDHALSSFFRGDGPCAVSSIADFCPIWNKKAAGEGFSLSRPPGWGKKGDPPLFFRGSSEI